MPNVTGQARAIASCLHPLVGPMAHRSRTRQTVDLRCDLHPRWMPGGSAVTFDSIHEGYRGIYRADLSAIVSPENS